MDPIQALAVADHYSWFRRLLEALLLTLAGGLAMLPLLGRSRIAASPLLRRLAHPAVFLLALAAAALSLRYAILFIPFQLNPDEGQMVAQAITLRSHPVFWVDVDGTTSGPLNSYGLLWGLPFGLAPGYATARLFGLACLGTMLGCLYFACRRMAGDRIARLAVFPTFLFLAFASYSEWVHYSSEQVPLALLGGALLCVVRLRRRPSSFPMAALLGFLLGLAPFAKLQTAPFALLLGLLGTVAIGWGGRADGGLRVAGRLAVLAVAGIGAVTIALLPTVLAGGFDDFWQSYIRMGKVYATAGSGLAHNSYITGSPIQVAKAYALFLLPRRELILPLYLTWVVLAAIVLGLVRRKLPATRTSLVWLAGATAAFLGTYAMIILPRRPFPHYHLFLILALPLATAAALRIVETLRRRTKPEPIRAALGTVAVLAGASVALLIAALAACPQDPESMHRLTAMALVFHGIVPLGLLAVVALLSWRCSRFAGSIPQGAFPLAYGFLFLATPLLGLLPCEDGVRGKVGTMLRHETPGMNRAILAARTPDKETRMAIWGWAPQFAAETGTTLGTRDSVCLFQFLPTELRDYYRHRYLADLRANRPALFLEAMGLFQDIGFIDPRDPYALGNFPELAAYVEEGYRLVFEENGMRLYIRRDLADSPTR